MADNGQQNPAEEERRRRLAKVRRRLDFGEDPEPPRSSAMDPVMPKEAEALLDPVLSKTREASEKWNFDFANEVPLEGVWEWQKVDGGAHPDFKELTIVRENIDNKENRSI